MDYKSLLKAIRHGGKITANINSNMDSVVAALEKYGEGSGLNAPHRLAQFVAQLAHESGGFVFDREIWGPTAAQKRYEGRKDLGNTIKGDGSKFRGYGPIQLTGRRNVTKFWNWCRAKFGTCPDFVAVPSLICTDPWEGMSAVWFWDAGNQTGKSLNVYADRGDNEMVTRMINGGLNGYDDRLKYYDRAALFLLGFNPSDVKAFQVKQGLLADGISGPRTRARLHAELTKLQGSTQKPAQPVRAPVDAYIPPPVETPAAAVPSGFWAWLLSLFK